MGSVTVTLFRGVTVTLGGGVTVTLFAVLLLMPSSELRGWEQACPHAAALDTFGFVVRNVHRLIVVFIGVLMTGCPIQALTVGGHTFMKNFRLVSALCGNNA